MLSWKTVRSPHQSVNNHMTITTLAAVKIRLNTKPAKLRESVRPNDRSGRQAEPLSASHCFAVVCRLSQAFSELEY